MASSPVDRSNPEVRKFREREGALQERISTLREERREYIRKKTKQLSSEHPEYPGEFAMYRDGTREPDEVFKWDRSEYTGLKTEIYSEARSSDRFDELTTKIEDAEAELNRLFDQALDQFTSLSSEESKRDRIEILFAVFDRAVDATRTADIVDCSVQHVRRFTYDSETGKTRYKEWERKRKQNQVAEPQYDRIRDRDGDTCVRCGTKEDCDDADETGERTLLVHHIIPVANGGSGDDDNLALLCPHCHELAHDERGAGAVIYDHHSEFWRWVDAGPEAGPEYDPKQGRLSEFL